MCRGRAGGDFASRGPGRVVVQRASQSSQARLQADCEGVLIVGGQHSVSQRARRLSERRAPNKGQRERCTCATAATASAHAHAPLVLVVLARCHTRRAILPPIRHPRPQPRCHSSPHPHRRTPHCPFLHSAASHRSSNNRPRPTYRSALARRYSGLPAPKPAPRRSISRPPSVTPRTAAAFTTHPPSAPARKPPPAQ